MDALAARVARLEQQGAVSPSNRVASTVADKPPRAGVALMNRIGAVTVALGIIFFFKYAVDEHLIGPWSGVLLGVLFGVALVAAGEWLRTRVESVFAQGISGCGLASLYISMYAATGFYKLLVPLGGFAAMSVVSVLAFALSVRNRSAAIATLGVVGALLTQLLLHDKVLSTDLELGYSMLLNATALAIAGRQQWRVLVAVTGALSVGMLWLLWIPKHSPAFLWFTFLLAALEFGFYWRLRAAPQMEAYVIGHVAILMGCLRFLGADFANQSVVSQLTSLLLLVYGIASLAYGIARSSSVNRNLGLTLVVLVILKLYFWDVWRLDRAYRITAFLLLGALLLLGSWVYSRSGKSAS